jgi:orotate phosphoribosyltransferase
VTPEEAAGLFESHGAMLSGHFLLSSGRHSDRYVEKARILEQPAALRRLADDVASWYDDVDAVVSPAVGAVAWGFAVAESLGSRFLFAERVDGAMVLRRGFRIRRDERVLVVEDVITTGASAREVHTLVVEAGAHSLGVAALVDRSGGDVGFPFRAVLRVEARSWEPSACPLCREGRPLEAPGSRHLVSRG